jgi:putative flippase GtrA
MKDNASPILSKERRIKWVKFLIGGGLNFALTYAVYLALNIFLFYQYAYFLAFVIGIIWAYWFNSTFVFEAKKSVQTMLAYPSIYLIQYLLSALILWLGVYWLGAPEFIVPIIATGICIPMTYFLNKLILEAKK